MDLIQLGISSIASIIALRIVYQVGELGKRVSVIERALEKILRIANESRADYLDEDEELADEYEEDLAA